MFRDSAESPEVEDHFEQVTVWNAKLKLSTY